MYRTLLTLPCVRHRIDGLEKKCRDYSAQPCVRHRIDGLEISDKRFNLR